MSTCPFMRSRARSQKKGRGNKKKNQVSKKAKAPSAKEKAQIRALFPLRRTTLKAQFGTGECKILSKMYVSPFVANNFLLLEFPREISCVCRQIRQGLKDFFKF